MSYDFDKGTQEKVKVPINLHSTVHPVMVLRVIVAGMMAGV
jgi:hypothetical protein